MLGNQEENFEEFSNDEENSQDQNYDQMENQNEIQEVNEPDNQDLIESKQDHNTNNEYSKLAHTNIAHTSNTMHQFMQNMDLGFSSYFYSNRHLEVEGIKTFLNKDSNHGLTGIKNLGNSCYINTVMQCLSHCVELTFYILAKLYSTEINKSEGNQLIKRGLKPGHVMNVLNKIFTPLWVNGDKFFIPNELKALIANSISQFNNSNQQDSHELLLYILDMIHEDTNQAPIQLGNSRYYDECLPKMDNESDISASKRFWKYYKDRNNSIIVDLFTGQLKNTIQCFACNNKSVIFEPFVTLPLAIPIMKRVDVIVVPAINIKSTIKLTIYVSESALFIDLTTYLKKYLSPEMKVERFRTLLVNGRSHTSKFTKNTENIYTMSRKGFIFCYEIDEAIAEGEEYYPFITLVREFKNIIVEKPEEKLNKDEDIISLSQNIKVSCELPNESITKINSQIEDKENFSFPRLFPVPPLSTIKELRQSLYGHMRKFCEPSHMINEKFLSNKYRDFVENYKITKSVDESEYNQIIKEEYNFFFSQNQISIKDKKSDDEISKLKEEFLETLPFRVMLVSTKDELKTKPKLFFSGKYEDFSKTLPDNAKIEKLIDIIKAGFKLVIEVKNREEIKLRMNQIISISNKDKEIDFTKIPTIYDCLDHFSLYEKLDKGNEWYCSQCRKLQSSYKKIEIFYVPKNLIVVFNRFETKMLSKFQIQLLKNSNFVKYPVNGLNLWDFVQGAKDPKPTYDLYSVSQHSGSTEGGHHATACRNFGKWYEFDDTSIFPSEENLIVSPEGYVLFYRRQDKKN